MNPQTKEQILLLDKTINDFLDFLLNVDPKVLSQQLNKKKDEHNPHLRS